MMTNPWLKSNPFMSMWLSGANAIAGSMRGHAMADFQRIQTKMLHDMMRQSMTFWSAAPLARLPSFAKASQPRAVSRGASARPAASKTSSAKRTRRG